MGKKHKSNVNLGRSLIKDRFGSAKGRKYVSDNSMLHTTEVQDGYDWGRLNLQSVTEESSFQEFLSTAELAGTEFQAEKLNIKFINPQSNVGLLTKDEIKKVKSSQSKHRSLLRIPRRPKWDASTTPAELDQNEKEHFLEWRRSLAQLQEEEGILLTPYEKNLEFWRQLWRVIERSDVIVQIVDARNPLLFRCEDVEKYVKEVSEDKINLLLINKADFLTEDQRRTWCEYFTSIGVNAVFFSAVLSDNTNEDNLSEGDGEIENGSVELSDVEEENEGEPEKESQENAKNEDDSASTEAKIIEGEDLGTLKNSIRDLEEAVNKTAERLEEITSRIAAACEVVTEIDSEKFKNSSKIYSREELIDLFRSIHQGPKVTNGVQTIGLIGYPNVGKSSTINALLEEKKVSVSATPGKTKHFQTLYLDQDLLLCDCPGLVMPSFVFSKAEMILNGVLPIDQMRDYVPPVNLVCSLIPKRVFEDMYGIMLPQPMEGEDPNRPPTFEELLNAYGYNRGFMTSNGQPDMARSSRYILKDYMNGKLLYCHAPPKVEQEQYHTWPERQKAPVSNRILPPSASRAVKPNRLTTEDVDDMFFKNKSHGVHVKGSVAYCNAGPNSIKGSESGINPEKPWKKINKHANKNKRVKLRKLYVHLDKH